MNNIAQAPLIKFHRPAMQPYLQRTTDVLIISDRLENRKKLQTILEGLPVSIYLAATIKQAEEIMSNIAVEIIFCEEILSDGSYRLLLKHLRTTRKGIHLV